MKALTAFEWGHVKADLAYEQNRITMWKNLTGKLRGTAEKIVEAAIIIFITAICIAAVIRVHESCTTTSCFSEVIATIVLPVTNVN